MKEARDLEFKEKISNSFLKTVSAFANYGEGRILFGVDDNGNALYNFENSPIIISYNSQYILTLQS